MDLKKKVCAVVAAVTGMLSYRLGMANYDFSIKYVLGYLEMNEKDK